MVGHSGFPLEQELLLKLAKIAPKLEMVFIDTRSDFALNHPLPQEAGLDSLECMRIHEEGSDEKCNGFQIKVAINTKIYCNLVYRCCP